MVIGELPEIETKENRALRIQYSECLEMSMQYLPVTIIRQGDPREAAIAELIVDGQPSNHAVALDIWVRELNHV
jgi:hypothetical protein